MTLVGMVSFVGDALLAHAAAGCYRCGRGDSLIDTDIQIVGEGALAFCRGCVTEFAEVAGVAHNRAEWSELQAKVAALESEVERARDREARFNAALAAAGTPQVALRKLAPEPQKLVDVLAEDTQPHLPLEIEPAGEESRCLATTKAGNPCKGTPLEGGLCFSHQAAS